MISMFLKQQINNSNVVELNSGGTGGTDAKVFWIYYLPYEKWRIIATDRSGGRATGMGDAEWRVPKQWSDIQASVTYQQRANSGYTRKRFHTTETLETRLVNGEVFLGERTYEDKETGFKAKTWVGYRFHWHEIIPPVASEFIKSLGIDETSLLFRSSLSSFPLAQKDAWTASNVTSPEEMEWYRTKFSEAYEKENPGRVLRYGFSGGDLTEVRLATSWGNHKNQKEFLDKAFADFKRLGGKRDDKGHWMLNDERLSVRYEALCSPEENFFATIQIRPTP
ncbi:MAG: hypothetical protein ABIR24_12975 [Verrucomicrobiota bacterium]